MAVCVLLNLVRYSVDSGDGLGLVTLDSTSFLFPVDHRQSPTFAMGCTASKHRKKKDKSPNSDEALISSEDFDISSRSVHVVRLRQLWVERLR